MTRAVLYARISEVDDASTSVARQKEDLGDLARREGWTVVEAFVDDGVSGRTVRPKALRAVDMLADGRAEVLAVWKFDRFSREGLGALVALFDALEHREGARFVALKDSLDSETPAWRIVASVLAEVARMESENTRLRVKSAILRMKTDDRFPGGNVPMGYRASPHPSGVGRVLEVDEEEASILRAVAERVIKGASVSAEALRLNDEARLRPRRAEKWKAQSLLQTLTGPAIVGRVTHDGKILSDPTTGLPRSVWEPALPLEVWHGVRAALDARKKKQSPRSPSGRSRLLAGLVVCASCERKMYTRTNGRGIVTYGCSSRSQGIECPAPVAITAERLEKFVRDQFLDTLGGEPVVEYRPHDVGERPEIADLNEAIADTHEAMRDRSSDRPALLARLEDLEARLDGALAAPASMWDEFVESGETYRDALATDDVARHRSLLSRYISCIAVAPGFRGAGVRRSWDASRVDIRWDERAL